MIFLTLFWNTIFARPIEYDKQPLCAIHVPICDDIYPAISEQNEKMKKLKDRIIQAGELTEKQKKQFHQELQNVNIQLESIYEHGKTILRDRINKTKNESVNGKLSRKQNEAFKQEMDVLRNLYSRMKSQGVPQIVRYLENYYLLL